jgi:AcrR family transcriptional regulator
VAAELFATKGYEATSIREIGDAAGILSGSLYHHFSSKTEMLHDLLKPFVVELPPLYEKVVAQDRDAASALRKLMGAALQVCVDHTAELTIIMRERKLLRSDPQFHYTGDAIEEVERIWYGVLQEGVRSGAFSKDLNVNLALRMIMDLISSTVNWYTPNSRYTLDEIASSHCELVFNGLQTKEAN